MKLDVYDVVYALNDVSDYLVMETAEKSRQLKERIIIKWASLAACACLFFAVAVYSVYMNGGFHHTLPGNVPGVSTESDSGEKDPNTEQNAPNATDADDSAPDGNTDNTDNTDNTGSTDSIDNTDGTGGTDGTGAGAQGSETTPAAVPVSMELTSAPRKTSYVLGDAPNLAGLSFKVKFSDGTEGTVSDGFTCGVRIFEALGTVDVSVGYNGVRGTFRATVSEPEVESISIATYPDRVEYYIFEYIDTSGLSVNVTYKNGYTRTVSGGLSLQTYDWVAAGTKTVYVKYGGKTAPFRVTYKDYDVAYIEIKTKPKKLSYYVGEKFDPTGMTLFVMYENGKSEIISDRFTYDPDHFPNDSQHMTVTVKYGGARTTLEVEVRFKGQDELLMSGRCGNDLNFELTYNGELTINGTGSMWGASLTVYNDYRRVDNIPWEEYKDIIRNVKIADGVTSIGNYIFYECFELQSIDIPDSVTSIGKGAFCNCVHLYSVELPKNLTAIEESTFDGCDFLGSCTLGNSVRTIGKRAFYGCSYLTEIALPDSVASIGESAFGWCYKLDGIKIPGGVTSISNNTFYGCSGITEITIPDSITSIGDYAFCKCAGLTEITIPGSVRSVGAAAFLDCKGLARVNIKDGVETLGESAFSCCWEMGEIRLPKSVRSIGIAALSGCNEVYIENPDCEICDEFGTFGESTDTTIHGYCGSTAEAYAKKYEYNFIPID